MPTANASRMEGAPPCAPSTGRSSRPQTVAPTTLTHPRGTAEVTLGHTETSRRARAQAGRTSWPGGRPGNSTCSLRVPLLKTTVVLRSGKATTVVLRKCGRFSKTKCSTRSLHHQALAQKVSALQSLAARSRPSSSLPSFSFAPTTIPALPSPTQQAITRRCGGELRHRPALDMATPRRKARRQRQEPGRKHGPSGPSKEAVAVV